MDDRREAAKIIGNDFPKLPNKVQAWQDLHRLSEDKDGYVPLSA